jgi:hydrogenase-1 operon protein HyaF
MSLDDIAVRCEPPVAATIGGVDAIVHEIAALLARLADSGSGGCIDLRSLPLAPADHECLESWLGDGAVRATLDALGPSEIRETGVPGVWWVTHRDSAGAITAELIEVACVPEILASHRDDVRTGLAQLRARLEAAPQPHAGTACGGGADG